MLQRLDTPVQSLITPRHVNTTSKDHPHSLSIVWSVIRKCKNSLENDQSIGHSSTLTSSMTLDGDSWSNCSSYSPTLINDHAPEFENSINRLDDDDRTLCGDRCGFQKQSPRKIDQRSLLSPMLRQPVLIPTTTTVPVEDVLSSSMKRYVDWERKQNSGPGLMAKRPPTRVSFDTLA
ncbi:hypothetical protein BC941DRAFT_476226 [Chlamydoabsidia padenii]|nr:hypothetical protein BC941DRAFT_476226 [Chlamydoabsidia padenii]